VPSNLPPLETPQPRLADHVHAFEEAFCAGLLTFVITYVDAMQRAGFPFSADDADAAETESPVHKR